VTVEEKIIRKVSYCEKITVVDFDKAKKDLAMTLHSCKIEIDL
jgi:hypothetical protein